MLILQTLHRGYKLPGWLRHSSQFSLTLNTYVEYNSLSSSVLNSLEAFLPSPMRVEALTLTSYRLYFSER